MIRYRSRRTARSRRGPVQASVRGVQQRPCPARRASGPSSRSSRLHHAASMPGSSNPDVHGSAFEAVRGAERHAGPRDGHRVASRGIHRRQMAQVGRDGTHQPATPPGHPARDEFRDALGRRLGRPAFTHDHDRRPRASQGNSEEHPGRDAAADAHDLVTGRIRAVWVSWQPRCLIGDDEQVRAFRRVRQPRSRRSMSSGSASREPRWWPYRYPGSRPPRARHPSSRIE